MILSHPRVRTALLMLLCLAPVVALIYGLARFNTADYVVCIGFSVFFTMFLLAAIHGAINWDGERTRILSVALAWGAGVATLGALAVESLIFPLFDKMNTDLATVMVAPPVEEILKSLGLLAILFVLRGRANPFLVALMIGLGFATYENAAYLTHALATDGYSQAFFEFVITRCLEGTLIHMVCTGMVGFAVLLRERSRLGLTLPATLITAMLVHSLCNGLFGIITNAFTETTLIVIVGLILFAVQRRASGGQPEHLVTADSDMVA